MKDILYSLDKTKILLITNNVYANQLTAGLIESWANHKSVTELNIIDLADYTISNLINDHVLKKRSNKELIIKYIDDYNVSSYPAILILKNDILIESIFGSYDNILDIVDIYL